MTKSQKKWLQFIDIAQPGAEKKRLRIKDTFSGNFLGYIDWSYESQQYVYNAGSFKPQQSPHREIYDKITELIEEDL